jgi:hypothetical protein
MIQGAAKAAKMAQTIPMDALAAARRCRKYAYRFSYGNVWIS